MFRGFLSGLFWGSMVGALVLAVLSLYAPLPTSQADAGAGAKAPAAVTATEADPGPEPSDETPDIAEPEPEEAGDAGEETGALTDPVTEPADEQTALVVDEPETETSLGAHDRTTDSAPEIVAVLDGPTFDQPTEVEPVKLPQISEEAVQTPPNPNTISTAGTDWDDQPLVITEKPFNTLPVAVLKTSPDALGFAEDVTVLSVPKVENTADEAPSTTTTALVAPVISELAPKPVEDPKLVRVASRAAPQARVLPQIEDDSATAVDVSVDTPIGVQVDPIENPVRASALKVVTGRLPTVGTQATVEPALTETALSKPDTPSNGALFDHAEAFNSNAQSLFSIVIIDVGEDGVPREQLLNSSYPITVAIDPATPNAASLMSQYRTAGIEVVALVNDLPAASNPSDVEVALSGYFDVVDQAVAVMEPLDKRLQNDRGLLQPVLGAVARSGHGFMTYEQGLNTTKQAATRAGVPAATIFRVLDLENENSTKIKRYLKRAAFNAGRDGSVVVVGRSFPDTMTAILEWALQNNDAALAIAPISAILKADANKGS